MSRHKDYYWLTKNSRKFLSRGYLKPDQTPEERIKEIGDAAERILSKEGFSEKFENYMKKGYFSLSTPIWCNFGNDKGLPISCNGSYIADRMDAILYKQAEVGMMTKYGAGTSGYFGHLRHRGSPIRVGGESAGPINFMELFDTVANVVSQGSQRRGSFAAYLDVEHPDILEFLQIQDEMHPIQNMSIGVCIGDQWMQDMLDGKKENRKVWKKIIEKGFHKGYPYIFWKDTVNNAAPQIYKDKGKIIHASNLCSEICLSSDETESFVCDLSSINVEHWDELKETDAIETLAELLDAAMSEYITKTENIPFMQSARNFAINQRAIGVGVLGWHSYLQSNMIPFESFEAKMKNVEIFKTINEKTLAVSKKMAVDYGEPELLKGYGERWVTRIAIAPTKSSSFILGQVSSGIEPIHANYFRDKLAKGGFGYVNQFLKKLLDEKGMDTDEVWDSILKKGGSVQHLSFLSQLEKDVFKTFGEISQKEIIIQASQRQKYIDQSQSLNLMIPAPLDEDEMKRVAKEVSQLLIEAWKMKVKTIYYRKSSNPAQELARSLLECKSCEA
jgi:ribonucleoside-diphosphate reductase alpha chain